MTSKKKTKQELLTELAELRRRVADYETAEVERRRLEEDRTLALAKTSNDLRHESAKRERAEEAQQQAHEELRAIYDGMVDGLLIADVETKRFLRANTAMLRMTGYLEEELLSLSVMELHPASALPKILENFLAQAEGRLYIGEDCPVVRKDGSIFYSDIATSRITYQGRPCLIGFFRDITHRKDAEEALRLSEEKYRTLVEAFPDAVVVSDLNGRVLYASPQTWELLGLPGDFDLSGCGIFDYVLPEDRQRLAANLARLVTAGVRRNTEYQALRRDGSLVPVDVSSALIRDAKGEPRAAMAVIRNITERKQAQEALERERQTLRHMLRSSDHERQVIAYEIHDELAQQLTGAIMQLQGYEHLKAQQPASAKAAYDLGVEMLRQAHAEARRLISGVRPPVLDESGIVLALAHLVYDQRTPGGPQIEFHKRVAFDRLAPVLENAIYRIAQEALANACKHSQSEKVRVCLVQENDLVRLKIQDWGIGFDPEAVAGDRFGLEGIRERVRLLGGTIRIESTLGRGTLGAVVLPLMLEEGEE